MSDQNNQTNDLLNGMAKLFEENRKQRIAELDGIRSEVTHVSEQVEEMRQTSSSNLERLSDRMHERSDISNERYTEIMMEINSLKERLGDLEKLVYAMADHLPQPTEEQS